MKRHEILEILNKDAVSNIKLMYMGDYKLSTKEVLWLALYNLSNLDGMALDAAIYHSGIRDSTLDCDCDLFNGIDTQYEPLEEKFHEEYN